MIIRQSADLGHDLITDGFVHVPDDGTRPRPLWSVPHAGRDYRGVDGLAIGGVDALRPLEDRFADRLLDAALARGQPAIIAVVARAMIDLNRDEDDYRADEFAPIGREGHDGRPRPSARGRAGLGVIPTRLSPNRSLWTHPITLDELSSRVRIYHRPYHRYLGARISEAILRWGQAVLLDLHSMPTLAPAHQPLRGRRADIVLGDAHGTSAAPWLINLADRHFSAHGLNVARNAPYAGGAITRRYGRPHQRSHALQIEIDRRLYLDQGEVVSAAADHLGRILADLGDRIADRVHDTARPMAAE